MREIQGLKVVFPHSPAKVGGPGTFQLIMTEKLQRAGAVVLPAGSNHKADLVFIVAGTRKLGWLLKHKLRGARVLHRLDGLKWRHKVEDVPFRHTLYCMAQNWLMSTIRSRFADCVVYQSEFVQQWWNERFGRVGIQFEIIRNGTDLQVFQPDSTIPESTNETSMICVEGNLFLDEATTSLLSILGDWVTKTKLLHEIRFYGTTSGIGIKKLNNHPGIKFMGSLPRSEMPAAMRKGRLFLSLEWNAPCPNSVVEALASGLPVVGFDTGAMRELVPSEAGELVPFGADPWKLEQPDAKGLISAVKRVLADLPARQVAAREVAEREYGADLLLSRYLRVIKQITES